MVEVRKRLVDIENRTYPYEEFPADTCKESSSSLSTGTPRARGIRHDVCLVLPGALEPFDAPFYIQAEWERQPLLLTQHRYGSYFILKTYVAMLPGTFFDHLEPFLTRVRHARRSSSSAKKE